MYMKRKKDQTVRYLGVNIVEKIGVTTHVIRICDTTKKMSYITILSRDNWGLKTKALKTIFKRIFEFILTYACGG